MRICLRHTLLLLLVSSAFIAVFSMGAINAWNLRNGFSDYLLDRELIFLDNISRDLAQLAQNSGGIEGIKASGVELKYLLPLIGELKSSLGPDALADLSIDEMLKLERLVPAERLPKGKAGDLNATPRPPDGDRDSEKMTLRLAIYQNDGSLLLGPELGSVKGAYTDRPIVIDGKTAAVLRLLHRDSLPKSRETNFLVQQLQSIFFVACAILLLAFFSARKVAANWVRPLLEMQMATSRIAQGELSVRLSETRSDEIGDAMRNINRMAHGLQRMEDTRRQWLADISHELRTPLAVLRGEIDALIDGVRPLTPGAVISLREEALRLGSLVEDLHLLSLADLKELPCYFEEIDAEALITQSTQRFALRALQKQLNLQFHAAQTTINLVRWDSRRIDQLLSNLLENSLRYTDAPGEVRVQFSAHSNHLAIDIEDSAPSVPDKDLSKLFEPLYRVDAARSRDSGGSGLGLAICSAIVKSHRGSIEAKASALGGLHIHVELPWTAEESP